MKKLMKRVFIGPALLVIATNSSAAPSSNFDRQQICRATIGAVMGRDPKIIKVNKVDAGVVHVSYTRPDDGTVWAERCRFERQKVVWATSTGRWRDDPMDGVIIFAASATTVTITQKFADGSSGTKSYTRSDLRNN